MTVDEFINFTLFLSILFAENGLYSNQGLVSGNFDKDVQSIRMFVADGGECLVAQSYSKIMGIYAERVGTLSIVRNYKSLAIRIIICNVIFLPF